MEGWKKLCTAKNGIQAEIIKSYLEANGVKVYLLDEAVGSLYGLSAGPLAEVDLLVAEAQFEAARKYLEDYQEDEA